MGNCCGCSPTCACLVVAGSANVTVSGSGSPANPFSVSVDSGEAIQVTVSDTGSLDLTLTGTDISGVVVPSADPNNCTVLGTDGGVFTPCPAAIVVQGDGTTTTVTGTGAAGDPYVVTALASGDQTTVSDTSSLDLTLAGTNISGVVVLSPNAGNQVTNPGNGLYVPPAVDATTVSDTATVDLTKTGNDITAAVIISPDPGNSAVALPNGIFVPTPAAGTPVTVTDTATVDLTLTGQDISADVKISTDANNCLEPGSDGALFVQCPDGTETAVVVTDTGSVDASITGNGAAATPYSISAVVKPSADPGNVLVLGGDGGVFVPAGGSESTTVSDTSSINLTLAGTNISGVVVLSPNAGNQVTNPGNGLFVPPATGEETDVNALDTATVDTSVTGTGSGGNPYVVSSSVKISAAADNCLVANGDGLFIPCPDGSETIVTPGTNVTVTGTGTTVDPYVINAAGGGGAASIVGVTDTATLNLSITGDGSIGTPYVISGNPIISPNAGNQLTAVANGLFVPAATGAETIVQVADTPTINASISGAGTAGSPYVISAVADLSTDTNQCLTIGTDGGLYVECPDGSETQIDAGTNVTVTGTGTTADPYVINAAGGAEATTVSDTSSLNLTLAGVNISGDVIISPNAGNTLTNPGNGLYAPLTLVANGDVTAVTGTGTAGDPFHVNVNSGCGLREVAGVLEANTEDSANWPYACTIDGGSPIFCGPDGQLYGTPDTTAMFDEITTIVAAGTTTVNDFMTLHGTTVGGAPGVLPVGPTWTITNPSTCRSMLVSVFSAVAHGDMRITGGLTWNIGSSIRVISSTGGGPAPINGVGGGHQQWSMTSSPGGTWGFDVQGVGSEYNVVLPPGASMTIRQNSFTSSVLTGGGAAGTINSYSTYLRYKAWTI